MSSKYEEIMESILGKNFNSRYVIRKSSVKEYIKIRMSLSAIKKLKRYFKSNPEKVIQETDESKINPIKKPQQYISYELTHEPNHTELYYHVKSNNGYFDEKDITRWIEEEGLEQDHIVS